MAITALSLGGAGLLMLILFAPLSLLAGIAGIVTGIIALRRVRAGTADGRGMAIGGLWMSSVAVVISVALVVLLVNVWNDGLSVDESWGAAPPEYGGSDPYADQQDGSGTDPAPNGALPPDSVVDGGERPADLTFDQRELLYVGESAPLADYTVLVRNLTLDAEAELVAADPGNPPAAAGQYVLTAVTVTYHGTEPADVQSELELTLFGADGGSYLARDCPAFLPDGFASAGPMGTSAVAQLSACFDVPDEAVGWTAYLLVRHVDGPSAAWRAT